MIGAMEWFAAKGGHKPEGSVAYVDPTGPQSMSYAGVQKSKPFWLLTAFAPER